MTTSSTTSALNRRAAVHPWVVIAFICIPVFIGSLDLTVVSAFLPDLLVDLGLPVPGALDDASWVVGAYLLAYAISLTFMGRVSDLLGRRAVYVFCLVVFIAGSVLVAIADGAPTDLLVSIYNSQGIRTDPKTLTLVAIIFGRVVQALGAGALVPVSLALVADLFPPERRAQPLGLIGAVDTLGLVLGHLYGGIFVQFFHWHWLFWINVPVTLVTIGLVLWAMRNVPTTRHTGRFDFLGTALIVGAISCLNIGLGANIDVSGSTRLQDFNALPPYAGPLLLTGALFLLGFVLVENRVRYPLINLRLFRQRNFSAGVLTNLFVGFCLMIGLVSVPILVNVREAVRAVSDTAVTADAAIQVAALQTGLLLATLTIPMAIAALPGGWLSMRIGMQRTALLGLGTAAVGFLLIWQTWYLAIPDLIVAAEMTLVGVGLGLTFSPITASVINAAGDEERGVASALVIVMRLLGMTISVSLLTNLTLQRVTSLAAGAGVMITDPQYGELAARALAELGLVGAVACLIALLPAALLQGRGRAAVHGGAGGASESRATDSRVTGD